MRYCPSFNDRQLRDNDLVIFFKITTNRFFQIRIPQTENKCCWLSDAERAVEKVLHNMVGSFFHNFWTCINHGRKGVL